MYSLLTAPYYQAVDPIPERVDIGPLRVVVALCPVQLQSEKTSKCFNWVHRGPYVSIDLSCLVLEISAVICGYGTNQMGQAGQNPT